MSRLKGTSGEEAERDVAAVHHRAPAPPAAAILPPAIKPETGRKAGPGRPQGNTAEGTRERILDVAEALFADGGFDGTSVRDIAALAEVELAMIASGAAMPSRRDRISRLRSASSVKFSWT